MNESEKRAAPGRLSAADVEAIVLVWQSEGMEDCSVDLHEFADWEDAEAFLPQHHDPDDGDRGHEMYFVKAVHMHPKGVISA